VKRVIKGTLDLLDSEENRDLLVSQASQVPKVILVILVKMERQDCLDFGSVFCWVSVFL